MKNAITPAIVIVLLFAAYSFGQVGKPRPKCCCEHSQQMADDLHYIRTFLEKEFKNPPPPVEINIPPFVDPGRLDIPEFDGSGVKPYKPGQKRR